MPIFYSKIRCFCLFTTCSIVSFVYHIWHKFRLFTVCILPAGYNHQSGTSPPRKYPENIGQPVRAACLPKDQNQSYAKPTKKHPPWGIPRDRCPDSACSLISYQPADTGWRKWTSFLQVVPLFTRETWKIVLAGTKSPLFFLSIRSMHISAISFTG